MRNLIGNLQWKLLAVILAYGLWLAVIEEKQALGQLEVPVRFENLAPNMVLVGDQPSSILVRVQAAERTVKELQPTDVEVVVDLADLSHGTHNVRLEPDSPAIILHAIGVQVLEAFPRVFEVELESKLTIDVPVRAELTGEPIDGFEIGAVTVRPATVKIVGPESAVAGVTEAFTRAIDVGGKRENFEEESAIDVASPDVTLLGRSQVKVTVAIVETMTDRVLADLAVVALGTEYQSRLRPAKVDVTVHGPERLLQRLNAGELVAYVDTAGLEPQRKRYELPLQIRLVDERMRERVQVMKLAPEQVAVRILEEKLPPPEPKPDEPEQDRVPEDG